MKRLVARHPEDAQPAEVDRRRRPTSERPARGGAEEPFRALIVEPDLFFAEFLGAILRDAVPQFVVREVPSLSGALDHLFASKGVELIITNLTVADDAGPIVPRMLRRGAPDAAIIVLTEITAGDVADDCLHLGADRVLPKKKLTENALLAAITDVVNNRR